MQKAKWRWQRATTENPRGPDGNVLRCHHCRGPAHLVRDCPNEGSVRGSASAAALAGLVEYRDLAEFSQFAGIYATTAEEETVEHLY